MPWQEVIDNRVHTYTMGNAITFLRFKPALQAEIIVIMKDVDSKDVDTYIVAITELTLLYDHPEITLADWFNLGLILWNLKKACRRLVALNSYKVKLERDRILVANKVRKYFTPAATPSK